MTDSEVFNKIIGLINRTGILSSVTLTLKDGGLFRGIPTGVNVVNNKTYVEILDETTDRTTRIPAEQITGVSD